MFFLRFLVVGAILFLVAPTRAAPAASSAVEKPVRYLDYRPILVLSDAVAAGLLVTAFALDDGPRTEVAWTGVGTYVLVGPTVHLAHGQSRRAAGSLAVRVGAPVVGAGVGAWVAVLTACISTPDRASFEEGLGCYAAAYLYMAVGLAVGGVAAMVVDDGFLGRVAVEEKPSKHLRSKTHGLQIAVSPLLDQKRKTLGLSLVGAF